MEIYQRNEVTGNRVNLVTNDRRHLTDRGVIPNRAEEPSEPFAEALFRAVNQVNSLQHNADELEEAMLIYPEQVDAHEVMIASEKARLAVSLFKSVTEKAVRAYNDILNIR